MILHCPSDKLIKGTKYVFNALQILKESKLDFEFELIAGKSNKYVCCRLLEADILIDQPGFFFGRLAAEGLSAGCCVIGPNDSKWEGYSETPPGIHFDPDSQKLADSLKTLILDHKRRQKLMTESYEFWCDNFSEQAFVRYFEGILCGNVIKDAPLPNQKELLIKFAQTPLQKFVIKTFY